MERDAEFRIEQVPWERAGPELAAVRRAVFVIEQGVPEDLEWDGLDPDCRHVVARCADGTAIGTGRLLPDGHVGRMVVLAAWRGRGVGAALLDALVALGRERGHDRLVLNAQSHAAGFYARAGFAVSSGLFMEAGIPHVEMTLVFPGPGVAR